MNWGMLESIINMLESIINKWTAIHHSMVQPFAHSGAILTQSLHKAVETVKQNLSTAIAAEQIVHPAGSDSSLISCFNIGLAAPAFDFVRHSLLFSEMMALTRLWDDRGDVNSLPRVARLLRDGKLIEALVVRERAASSDVRQADTTLGEGRQKVEFSAARHTADQREADLRERISSWLQDFGSTKDSSELASLRKYRDELGAHSATQSRKPAVGAQYGDIQKALDKTIPIVSEVYRITTGINHDFKTTAAVWNDSQAHMWEIVRAATRGETFSPPHMTNDDFVRELTDRGVSWGTIRG